MAGQDIVFKGYAGDANVEVMRMDDQSLNMNEGNKVKFRSQDDDISFIHSSEANQLDIVSATIELSAPEENVTVNVDGALKAKTELGLFNTTDNNDFVIKRVEGDNAHYVFKNENENSDLIFKTNTNGEEEVVFKVVGNTGDVRIADDDTESGEKNKLQFYDANQYINVTIADNEESEFDDKTLNIIAEGDNNNGIVKIGDESSTEWVKVETQNFKVSTAVGVAMNSQGNITMNPDEYIKVVSDDQRPLEGEIPAKLVLERNYPDVVSGVATEDIGEIVGRGKDDNGGLVDYSSILFESKVVDAGDPIGAIYFKTTGAEVIEGEQNEKLMDINGSAPNTVTINSALDVKGSITMAGAAFTAPITSNEAGEHSLGTQATEDERGEWQALHLWDSGATNAKITFGDGTDDDVENNADVELEHIPTRGITINDDHRFQFRNNDTFIHSSNTDILNLVAPTLTLDAPTKVTLDAPIVCLLYTSDAADE